MRFPKSNIITFSLISLFILLISFTNSNAQQLSFPSAKGAGAYTVGGRGGVIIHVTNLNNSGPGSLRAAISMTVPRTIVFDVSGVINLTSLLVIGSANSNVTIAGQTAPEGGITIDGERLYLSNANNLICRYIRFKGGLTADTVANSGDGAGNDSFSSAASATNQIFDHCTFAFGVDEAASWYGTSQSDIADNITIQRCFFAESVKGSIIGARGGGNMSFNYNLFYNAGYRTPNIIGDNMNYDIINNVVIQSGGRLINSFGESNLNHIGNYIDYGNYTVTDRHVNLHRFGTIPQIYTNNNKIIAQSQGDLDNTLDQMNLNNKLTWKFHLDGGGYSYGDQLPANYFTDIQFPLKGEIFIPLTADEAYENVINNVGCNARLNANGSISDNFDTLDEQWLTDIASQTYPDKLPESAYNIPNINSLTRPNDFYLSNPHIPEIWFNANVPSGQNHNDLAPSGYTWIEEYLNGVDQNNTLFTIDTIEISPSTDNLLVSETIQLSAIINGNTGFNQLGSWSSSNEIIASVDANGVVTALSTIPDPPYETIVTITFTITDDNGDEFIDSAEITVFPAALESSAGNDQDICRGESTTLIASGGSNYIWDNGETTSSIDVNPNETRTYSVTISDDFGQSQLEEVTVTVNEVPIAYAGEDQTICQGDFTTLTASGGDTYLWDNGETTASIEVNPNEDTTYTVEVTSNNCSSSDSVIVSTNLQPNLAVSDDMYLYLGESTTLLASGAEAYQWSTNETEDSIIVTPSETTTYTVTGFLNGCERTVEVTVTILEPINANAGDDVTICSGESVTLNATGGESYLWDINETTSTITVSPMVNTTYTVTVTDALGGTDTDSVTITVNETPTITVSEDLTINEGENTTLTVTGGDTYLWSTGATTNQISVNPTVTTTYSVSGFSNNCEDIEQVTVTVIPEVTANAGADVTICSGESVTLNATGGETYVWNTGGTGASPTFSPTQTTTYTVTVTDAFGNTDSDSVIIFVNQLPTVTVSENMTIIDGETINLTAQGANSYQWDNGESLNTISVSPSETTTYTVVGTTNTCSAQAQVTVTVEGVFEASAGIDKRVCENNTSEVLLTASEGDSYLWNTGETTQSILVNPTSTTVYSVTIFQGTQQDTDEATVFVDPNPVVNITNGESVDILNGDFITLSATGANNYEWNNGATQPNVAVSPSATTTYEVIGYVGDCLDEKQVVVNVFQPVVADAGEDMLICLNEMATLTATGGDEYVWSNGETTQSIEVSPSETTDYTVTVFNTLDFDEAIVRVEVDLNCDIEGVNPIDEPSGLSFDIYPNPAKNDVNIKLSGSTLESNLFIYDITGKLVKRMLISNENLNPVTTTKINVKVFQPGVYFIKVIDQDRDITKKLIVR